MGTLLFVLSRLTIHYPQRERKGKAACLEPTILANEVFTLNQVTWVKPKPGESKKFTIQ